MVFFTSDLHFCHSKEFLYGKRGFENVAEMNEEIVRRWNGKVAPTDEVWILGDIMLNDDNAGINLLRQLNGHKYIIYGNHDSVSRIDLFNTLYNVECVGYSTVVTYNRHNFYLSHYPTLTGNFDDEKKKNFIYNLHGHTHQQVNFMDEKNPLMYHVGLDSHNCEPVSIDEVISDIRAQKNKLKNNLSAQV